MHEKKFHKVSNYKIPNNFVNKNENIYIIISQLNNLINIINSNKLNQLNNSNIEYMLKTYDSDHLLYRIYYLLKFAGVNNDNIYNLTKNDIILLINKISNRFDEDINDIKNFINEHL